MVHLRNSCRYETGQLAYSEYTQLLGYEDEQGNEISFPRKLNQFRYALRKAAPSANRRDMLTEFRSLVNEMLEAPDVAEASKLDAKLALLEAEGSQLIYEAIEGFSQLHMRRSLGTLSFQQIQTILQEQSASVNQWFNKMRVAIEEATRLKNPLLIGNSLTIMAHVRIGSLSVRRSYALMIGEEISWPENMLQAMMEEMERARKIYKLAEQLEGELRAQLLLADLFLMANQPEAAYRLASSVLPKAQAMDYKALQIKAAEHLSGQTPMQNMERAIIAAKTEDQDWQIANNTDEEMLDFARDVLKALDLPLERLPVVEREAFSERAIARERLHWCRHIELNQDLRHMAQPTTRYLVDPQRFCACDKHNLKSAIGHTDWDTVISTFKQTYCFSCSDQSPKQK